MTGEGLTEESFFDAICLSRGCRQKDARFEH